MVLQAASLCLQYPDDDLATLPVVRSPSTRCPRVGRGNGSAGSSTPSRPPRQRGRRSTTSRCSTSGADAACTSPGGPTARPAAAGSALAALKARYREAGVEFGGTELPDFLPAVLEFAATADLAGGLALLQEHRAGIELLRLALLDAGTPYAAPVEAVCALLPGPSPADIAAARALARRGPPREQVGLDLAPFGPAHAGGPR